MIFRHYDCNGAAISRKQLQEMQISTPVMEHVFSAVVQRLEKSEEKLRNTEHGAF